MGGVKLIVMYPTPKDVPAFERGYQDEQVPMAVQKHAGKTKLVATTVQGVAPGKAGLRSNRGGPFPLAPGARGVRRIGRWEGDPGARRQDLERRPAGHGVC
jgi:hypothetical protein